MDRELLCEIVQRVERMAGVKALLILPVAALYRPIDEIITEEKFRSLYKFPLGEKGRYSIRFGYRDRGRVWGVLEAFMDIAAGTVGGR